MAITNDALDTGKVVLTNLKYMKVIPYEDESGDTLGDKSLTFDTLLADSVSVQQDDNTVNSRDSETKDEPALENTVLGSYQIAATSLDVQDKILKAMIGWTIGTTDTTVAYAPTAYKPLYCMIIFAFNSTNKCFVAPKVKLNSKVVIASLKTSSGQIDIAGTAYAGKLTIDSTTVETPLASVSDDKLETVVPALAGE